MHNYNDDIDRILNIECSNIKELVGTLNRNVDTFD